MSCDITQNMTERLRKSTHLAIAQCFPHKSTSCDRPVGTQEARELAMFQMLFEDCSEHVGRHVRVDRIRSRQCAMSIRKNLYSGIRCDIFESGHANCVRPQRYQLNACCLQRIPELIVIGRQSFIEVNVNMGKEAHVVGELGHISEERNRGLVGVRQSFLRHIRTDLSSLVKRGQSLQLHGTSPDIPLHVVPSYTKQARAPPTMSAPRERPFAISPVSEQLFSDLDIRRRSLKGDTASFLVAVDVIAFEVPSIGVLD
ncbi:hypothetical protein BJ912DRAFT_138579 [Pholiota molesta]|nr:hypothetical protein BJ912DRAFT_138579 [Pholiota molesta]